MNTESLRTASTYINNLLLSRGLLRNGAPIEFANPAKAEGGMDATMGKVMNLVHDLILRRDVCRVKYCLYVYLELLTCCPHQREADSLSSISQNLQTLRTSSVAQTQTISRLEAQNGELDRKIALTSAQERAVRATLRTAETRTKALRKDMARLKGTVAQIRGQCAADVRRRDTEIQRLKKHLEGRRGRDGNGGQVGVVVVTPGMKKVQQGSTNYQHGVDFESPEYSLKQETTEFLTQLSQGLSDENDALIGLVRNTLATLRSLQGLPTPSTSGSGLSEGAEYENPAFVSPPSYESLQSSTDEVLEHLRGLLTTPNFVPLEELEMREEEILRLREGWEKMEARWREAVALMDGWRKRMVDTGDTINLDDLTKGLELDAGMPASTGVHDGSCLKEEDDVDDMRSSNDFEESVEGIDSVARPDPIDESSSIDSGIDLLPTSKVLAPTSANAQRSTSPSKRFIPSECDKPSPTFTSSKPTSRIPRQVHDSLHTVQQKLALAQAEADEAQGQRKRKSEKLIENDGLEDLEKEKGRKGKRRSTLSALELENLIGA